MFRTSSRRGTVLLGWDRGIGERFLSPEKDGARTSEKVNCPGTLGKRRLTLEEKVRGRVTGRRSDWWGGEGGGVTAGGRVPDRRQCD